MSYTVAVLCRPEAVAGFALAGLVPAEAADASDSARRIAEFLGDREVGIVLAQQQIHDELPDDVRRRLARRALPLVVPFPDPAWEAPGAAAEAYIVELLRQVIGYRVRLR